ncbi:MAG TPA: GNAT family N-acetyltransferase [Anaerolineales bacterium]|nr:GNAT family N-acetyltransferase [Anaerolineales bacterium]HLO31257.1 GNAT family N-acetyltransferase [Anaerolineales bacterium]
MNKIRLMQSSDVESVIRVHMDGFQGFFLTSLGPAFLQEFYIGVCEDPSGIAIVYDDSYVSGFVVGTIEPCGFYKRLIQKRWWKFGLASLRPAIHRPRIIPRLLRAFTLPGKTANPQLKTGTLMSLAVMQNCHGNGIGKQLVSAFLENSRQQQVEIVNLTTDAVGNDATNKFYLDMGFTLARVFATPEVRLMNEYVIRLQ